MNIHIKVDLPMKIMI